MLKSNNFGKDLSIRLAGISDSLVVNVNTYNLYIFILENKGYLYLNFKLI